MMRKVLSSYILTIISLSLVLFLLGFYLLVSSQSSLITNKLKEKINIVIELVDNYSSEQKSQLLVSLNANESVLSESIDFLTKEDARQIMVGEDDLIFSDDSLQNPFRDAIVLNIKSEKYNPEFIELFSNTLESQAIVGEVYYQEDLFDLVNSNLKKVSLLLLVVGIMMLLLAMSLIYNTVNLSLLTDKQKIQTMELVGAERAYIKKPYLIKALQSGFLSFLIALLLLAGFLMLLVYNFEFLKDALNYLYLGLIILLLFVLGVLIPFIITNNFVIKHLNKI